MNLNHLFNHQTRTVNIAAGILAVSALISRLLGVVRDWLLAKSFGAGTDLDIYFAAFKIPDFVYNILILGGVLVAFLPLFSDYFSKNKEEAWKFSSNCLNVFLFLLILVSFFLFLFTPSLVKLIVPGFSQEKIEKTILLTRIMLLSPIFLGLSSVFSGILQYFNRFLIYALCPILYNLGIIFGILFFSPQLGIPGVAIGVVLGAFLHFAIQIPSALSCGFSYKMTLDFKDPKIKRVFTLMIPRTLGISASQINLVVINAIASTLTEGSISIFNFANNIQYFPIGIIGASFAMAVFPTLSKNWTENEKGKFVNNFSLVFRQILYLILPISVLVFILRNEIVGIILKHGQFSMTAANLTSSALALFCIGLFASSLIPLFFRAFFSLKDTKTPTLIAIVSMIINVALSFFLTKILISPQSSLQERIKTLFIKAFSLEGIKDISVLGLPLAVAIGVIFQFILMMFFLRKRIGDFKSREIFDSFLKILAAGILMIISVCFTLSIIEPIFSSKTLGNEVSKIVIVSLIGCLVYLLATFSLNSPEIKKFKNLFLKKFSNEN